MEHERTVALWDQPSDGWTNLTPAPAATRASRHHDGWRQCLSEPHWDSGRYGAGDYARDTQGRLWYRPGPSLRQQRNRLAVTANPYASMIDSVRRIVQQLKSLGV